MKDDRATLLKKLARAICGHLAICDDCRETMMEDAEMILKDMEAVSEVLRETGLDDSPPTKEEIRRVAMVALMTWNVGTKARNIMERINAANDDEPEDEESEGTPVVIIGSVDDMDEEALERLFMVNKIPEA